MPNTIRCPRCGRELSPGDDPARPCARCLLAAGLGGDDPGELVHTRSGEPAFVPPSPAELAPHFPQLEIQGLLGQGGMGTVYRARQRDLEREVALKILRPHPGDPAFAERFLREARALARLQHPSIVSVHDFGRAGEHLYLIMELVDGTDLRHVIRSQAIAPSHALEIVKEVCGALQYAHDRGVVHRDVKPENILLDRAGRVKIADFGLAKMARAEAYEGSLTETRQAMGTPHYMAPEQIERPRLVDHRADIYSLGVVFYELLTGELPLGRFAPPSRKVELDVRLDEVVLKALEKEPERRYQQASQVRTEIEDIARTPVPRGEPVSESRSRSIWPKILLVLLLLTCVPLSCVAACVAFLAPARMEQVEQPFEYRIFEGEPVPAPVPVEPEPEPPVERSAEAAYERALEEAGG